jgi:hypothetical protein
MQTLWIVRRTYICFYVQQRNHVLLTSVKLSLSFPLSETEFPEEIDVSS